MATVSVALALLLLPLAASAGEVNIEVWLERQRPFNNYMLNIHSPGKHGKVPSGPGPA